MDVTIGCSTEFAKWKFSVTVEETEFPGLCTLHGLDPFKLLPREKFVVMYDEAVVLMSVAKVGSGKWPGSDTELTKANADQLEHLAKYRKLQEDR